MGSEALQNTGEAAGRRDWRANNVPRNPRVARSRVITHAQRPVDDVSPDAGIAERTAVDVFSIIVDTTN
jgi:hypothetical protein